MSPSVSINDLLSETEAPTSDEPVVAEATDSTTSDSSSSLLFSLFKSREHETADTTTTAESSGNRFLLALSEDHEPIDEDTSTTGESSSSNRMLSAEEIDKDHNAIPTASPAEVVKTCPTWGPSIVPRQFDDIVDDFVQREESSAESWKTKFTNVLQPGRALHTQHQLVHLESKQRPHNIKLELPEDIKNSRVVVMYGYEYRPIRLLFETSSLTEMLRDISHNFADTVQSTQNQAKIRAYIDNIFPAVARLWSEALSNYQPSQNIAPKASTCGGYSVPQEHLDEGVPNADVLIYAAVREQSSCKVDSKPSMAVCHFDQNMKPLIGMLSICLESMGLQDGIVDDSEILRHIASTKSLTGSFLGLSPNLFQYFRHTETGEMWGGRYVNMTCDETRENEVFLSNIVQEQITSEGEVHYEISTPIVRQVVRNHFDCQSMTGARLSKPLLDSSGTCAFSGLHLRYHFDEDMTTLSTNIDSAISITPLSMAILEDSSWYKANFSAATTPSFGRAAGCGFIYESCIVKGKVPDYSSGYFCDTLDESRTGCDFNHRNKAGCDLHRYAKPPPKFQYFYPENIEFGSVFQDVDYCPMRTKHLSSCSSGMRISSQFDEEFFDESSRCYETDVGAPICLETVCNSQDKSLSFIVGGKSFLCRYHGEVIDVGKGYSVVCPRLAAICPGLIVPSSCSGKGVADFCKEVPQCICDNPFDTSLGCWDS